MRRRDDDSDIEDDSDLEDDRPVRRRKKGSQLLYLAIALSILIGIGGLFVIVYQLKLGQTARDQQEQEQKRNTPAVPVTVEELAAAYKSNEVSADRAYKGRVLLVRGVVETVRKDLFGRPVVRLKSADRFQFIHVECSFPESASGLLAKLQTDDIVSIRGECRGKAVWVQLADCSLVR